MIFYILLFNEAKRDKKVFVALYVYMYECMYVCIERFCFSCFTVMEYLYLTLDEFKDWPTTDLLEQFPDGSLHTRSIPCLYLKPTYSKGRVCNKNESLIQ